jgi:hypothetical protein
MSRTYTTGSWKPTAGKQDMFVAAWSEFAAWDSIEAVRVWKSAPDFREPLARVLQHVAEFEPSELKVVATAEKEPET